MMRLSLSTLILAALPTVAAQAAPPVILHVPDGAMTSIDNADLALADERGDITAAEKNVILRKHDLADLKARKRDAKADRRMRKRELSRAERRWRKAQRRDDALFSQLMRMEAVGAAASVAKADDHVQWHKDQIRAERTALKRARARRSLARADYEVAQAELLDQHDTFWSPVLPPSVFAWQSDRIDDRADALTIDLAVDRATAADTLDDYVAFAD